MCKVFIHILLNTYYHCVMQVDPQVTDSKKTDMCLNPIQFHRKPGAHLSKAQCITLVESLTSKSFLFGK